MKVKCSIVSTTHPMYVQHCLEVLLHSKEDIFMYIRTERGIFNVDF